MAARTGLNDGLVVAFAVAALALVVRLPFIGHALWHDEAATVIQYVQGGWTAPWTDVTENDHLLLSVLARLQSPFLGTSPWAMRLWSIVPAVVACGLLTAVTSRVHSRFAGVVAGGVLALTPLVVDITAHARGYGLVLLGATIVLAATTRREGVSHVTAAAGWFIAAATTPLAAAVVGALWLGSSVARRDVAGAAVPAVAAALVAAVWWGPVASAYLQAVLAVQQPKSPPGTQLPVLERIVDAVQHPPAVDVWRNLVGLQPHPVLALTGLALIGMLVALLLPRVRQLAPGLLEGTALATVVLLAAVVVGLPPSLRFALLVAPAGAMVIGVALAAAPSRRVAVVPVLAFALLAGASLPQRWATPQEPYGRLATALTEKGVKDLYLATVDRAPGHLLVPDGPTVHIVVASPVENLGGVPARVLDRVR
ncbi:MAG: hypothetical protein WBG57_04145, partial [Ornithinimicrobium sp.]